MKAGVKWAVLTSYKCKSQESNKLHLYFFNKRILRTHLLFLIYH